MRATPEHHPSQKTPDEDLTGRILRARVEKTWSDHCDLALLDPETGHDCSQRGRLYQRESLAWKSRELLGDLPDYQRMRELPAVYVRHLRTDGNEKLWFVHERWGLGNPWPDLELREGDLIYGTVSHETTSRVSGEVAGYLVQLDDGPLLTLKEEEDRSGIRQPDIEVFIPVAELPWADGSIGFQPPKADMGHVVLTAGDRIQAMLFDIRLPPRAPEVSITRLIHHKDAHSDSTQDRWETAARLRFRLLFGQRSDAQSDEMPTQHLLEFRRFLLVDDDQRALEAYAELYRLNGAEVETVVVQRDRFSKACDMVARLLEKNEFDLVMVDNNLPGQGLGERLVEIVSRRLAGKPRSRFVLLTANPLDARTTLVKRLALQGFGVAGFIHRPMSSDQLQRLLAGENLWKDDTEKADAPARLRNPAGKDGGTSLDDLVAEVANIPQVHFVMLLRIDRDLAASEFVTAGRCPFNLSDLKTVLSSTGLHLLADGQTDQLQIRPDEAGNAELRAKKGAPACWRAFTVHGERWILGVGHVLGWTPDSQWKWWQYALSARLEQQSWIAWAHEASSFVELGMSHEGLCHEVFNLRNEMEALLQLGESWIRKPRGDPTFLPDLMAKMRRAHQDSLELAEHLLEGLSHRQSHVFLPTAMATVRSIVNAECEARNLQLEISPVPPIALPIPSAALVLPVVNLALNAAKHHYRQENRRVSIVVDVARAPTEASLLVDVRDNGPGLSLSARARLWQAGYSFAAARADRHGMGLWLSQRLANEAGGQLECVGDWRYLGTHFRLSFPIRL